ncbi:MAG: uroporphyrinogen-III C-methyltransferase [Gammaproteobacteria bacterium]|nr:uroporphyrinogen-III C-methyltransferase [Gammaproteobacteria bacterium]
MELKRSLETPPSSAPRQTWALTAILLALIANIMVLLLYNESRNEWHKTQENSRQVEQHIQQATQQGHTLETQLQHQDDKLSVLNETLQHLSQIMGPAENGLLIQAEYLAQLAQLNLKYQGDVSGTLALLKMIDQRLSTLSFSGLLDVRQVLAKDMAALQAVPNVDLPGIITKLNALSDEVTQLPLVPQLPRTPPTLKPPYHATKFDTYLTDWKDALSTSWHALERVVIIRHHGQPIEPLLAPEEFLYLKQNIQLQLQQAQWAALHQQQAVYVASLQHAASWINHYFTDNNLSSRALQQSLVELQKQMVQPALPDLSNLVAAMGRAQQSVSAPVAPRAAGAHA